MSARTPSGSSSVPSGKVVTVVEPPVEVVAPAVDGTDTTVVVVELVDEVHAARMRAAKNAGTWRGFTWAGYPDRHL
jgi:hypothetical protein